MFCKNCGTENTDEAKFCKNCGQPMEEVQPEQTAEPVTEEAQAAETADSEEGTAQADTANQTAQNTASYSGPVEYNSAAHSVTDDSEIPESTGTAIASMILGIASIVLCCSSFLGLIAGIIAIVLAQKERNSGRADNGYVKAGLICGIIGAILSALVLIYYIVVLIIGGTASILSDSSFYY